MSGLAGIFLRRPSPLAGQTLDAMSARLAHRGPSDEGYLLLPPDYPQAPALPACGADSLPVTKTALAGKQLSQLLEQPWRGGLAHRRSGLVTGTNGHQPLVRNTRAVLLDGALYNAPELRKRLEQEASIMFEDGSDAEVMLAAYEAWQDRALPQFEGAFSLVILDPVRRVVFAARDRLGVKPLYFLDVAEGLALASEQKALYHLPFCPRRISKTAVFEYLVKGIGENRSTGLVKSVQELLPGHCLELNLDTGVLKSWEWFKTEPNLRWENYRERTYKKHRTRVSELLAESMAMRLRAGGPLAAALSGGVDSSTLVSLLGKAKVAGIVQDGPFAAFTAGFPGQPFDETRLAQSTAEKAGLSWTGVYPKEGDLLANLKDLIRTHDLPLHAPGSYAQYRVMQAARQAGFHTLLDGQGADELFGGYANHFQAYMGQLWDDSRYGQLFYQLLQANNNFADRGEALRNWYRGFRKTLSSRSAQEEAFRKNHVEFSLLRKSFWDIQKRRLGSELSGPEPGLNQALTRDLTGATLRCHLRLADRNAMRFGIDLRTPFADSTALIEYVQRVPAVYKIKNGQSKSLLRSAVRGLVPEAVRTRRTKINLSGPDKAWIEALSPHLRESIGTPGMEEFMHINQIRENWDSMMRSALSTDPYRLFRLGALGLWMREVYHDGKP